MAVFKLPPPPTNMDPASPAFRDWFYKLAQAFVVDGSIDWDTINLPTEGANEFLGGPVSGADAQVSFRTLVIQDIPSDILAFAAAQG